MVKKTAKTVKYFQSPKLPKSAAGISYSLCKRPFSIWDWLDFKDGDFWKWWFCADELHEVFEFPRKATHIQFRAYREDGPGRIKIKFTGPYEIQIEDEENHTEVDHSVYFSAQDILGARKKVWYLELFYWS